MRSNVSRQYLKAMGIDCWLPRSENAGDDGPGVDISGQRNPVAGFRGQPASLAPTGRETVETGVNTSTNVSAQSPDEAAPLTVNSSTSAPDQQPIAQWPANSLETLLADCRVVVAEQAATPAEDDRPMLLLLERELTSPAEDLLAAMLKAIKVDRLSQFAATVSQSVAAEPLSEVCGRLRPSFVLVMATLSDTTALTELAFHRREHHSFGWLDVPVAISLHPQVLLENPQGKRPAWEDLKRVKAFLDGH